MSDDLRYPIGKFAAAEQWDAARLSDARSALAALPATLRQAIEGLSDAQLDTPYRDGGWTVRQTVHHIADSHMNAYCRFRLALTEEGPTIKPYLEAHWAELPDARTTPVHPSLQIIEGVHTRLVALIDRLGEDDWQRTFHHPQHGRNATLAETAALYAWHSRHHVAHITGLRERRRW